MHQMFYSIRYFLFIILTFSTIWMTANYSETCRVGKLEANFQVQFVKIFLNFHNIVET